MKFNKNSKYIELHSHLEGFPRYSFTWKLAKQFGINLPFENEEEFREFLEIETPTTLREFLKRFDIVLSVYRGNKQAISCLCENFVESYVSSNVCYVEQRFCPYLYADANLSVDEVTQVILKAFEEFSEKYGIVVRSILAILRTDEIMPIPDVISLVEKYKHLGIVGIDLAGDELFSEEHGGTYKDLIELFDKAAKLGIHRTVHAGENGSYKMVNEAVYRMHAQRIGHGYNALNDEDVLKTIKEKNILLEICPSSSFLTGSVPIDPKKHPINKLLSWMGSDNEILFSINCDDCMITGKDFGKELMFTRDTFNLTEKQIGQMQLSAAKSAFLEVPLKDQLIKHIKDSFGL